MLTVQLLVGHYQSITVLAPNVAGEACPSSRSRASSALFTHVHTCLLYTSDAADDANVV